ncbi:MAG TPA: hypothetical protein VMR70_18820 [Flavisolibacter sp.]|nr:hypothetical protein [Flavisolibacter sp.]
MDSDVEKWIKRSTAPSTDTTCRGIAQSLYDPNKMLYGGGYGPSLPVEN